MDYIEDLNPKRYRFKFCRRLSDCSTGALTLITFILKTLEARFDCFRVIKS